MADKQAIQSHIENEFDTYWRGTAWAAAHVDGSNPTRDVFFSVWMSGYQSAMKRAAHLVGDNASEQCERLTMLADALDPPEQKGA